MFQVSVLNFSVKISLGVFRRIFLVKHGKVTISRVCIFHTGFVKALALSSKALRMGRIV